MKRLRPTPSDEELRELYTRPHDSTYFKDHRARITATIAVGEFMLEYRDPWSPQIADLSCGDAKIATELNRVHNSHRLLLGDIAPGYEFHGKIEDTIHQINPVSMFVLSETLEHVNDPVRVLLDIREKTDMLLLSTPIDEPEDSSNVQHLWSWTTDDIENLLRLTGFNPVVKNFLYLPTYYDFQIWGCR